MTSERRALVQSEGAWWTPPDNWQRKKHFTKAPGTIAWSEHLEAYEVYAKKQGRDQSAEKIDERGGFGYLELIDLLGHEPTTWLPRSSKRRSEGK